MDLLVGGVTVGCIYALIAGGFVLIFRGTSILNFAQGALVLLGGYVAYSIATSGIPGGFYSGVFGSILVTGAVAWLIQRGIFARLGGRPLFSLFMVTLGLDVVMFSLISSYRPWSHTPKEVGSPWGIQLVQIAGTNIPRASLWIIATTGVALGVLALFLRFSKWGLAMQITAMDNEVATILGIRVQRVFALSWLLAGALAALAGAFLGTFPRLLEPATHGVALRAIPAAILGGIDSLPGTGLAAILLGVIEVYTAAYAPGWLGQNFHLVMPYMIMFIVLLVRPQGFFGTREREVHRA
jgi:branched-chain amino acid transport system permease protein